MSEEQTDFFAQLAEEIDKKAQKVKEVSVLFFDLSSSCTGYTLVKVNFAERKAKFINSGAIWFNDSWTNQEKYYYLYSAITNYFNIVGQIDLCVCEAYMINQKKLMGSQVGPELHGAVQVALSEIGVKYYTILPQSWRKALDIKATTTLEKGKKVRDFKTPTKDLVLKHASIPTTITSNITSNSRTTPNDVYDSVAIAMGFLKKINVQTWDFSNLQVQTPINID
jgi:Holliday junction resolvasome RuvABC endonuclease subunit